MASITNSVSFPFYQFITCQREYCTQLRMYTSSDLNLYIYNLRFFLWERLLWGDFDLDLRDLRGDLDRDLCIRDVRPDFLGDPDRDLCDLCAGESEYSLIADNGERSLSTELRLLRLSEAGELDSERLRFPIGGLNDLLRLLLLLRLGAGESSFESSESLPKRSLSLSLARS